MKPSLLLFSAFSCAVGAAIAQDSGDLNSAHVRPEAIVPLMAKTPVLDGVIAPGEWQTLHVARFVGSGHDRLQNRPGEYWIGSDGKNLLVAVRSAVHPQLGVLAKHAPVAGADVPDTIFDDSIEIWVANSPGTPTGNQGKAEEASGQYFQIILNSLGAVFDQSFEVKDKIGQKFWQSGLRQGHNLKDGVWTAEVAIPLDSLGVKDLDGPLAFRIARNYKSPWDQSRSEPLTIAFDAIYNMSRLRFSADAPVVSEVGFQTEAGTDIRVDVFNPGNAPLPVTVRLGSNAKDQPRYYGTYPATLAPGETRRFSYAREFFTPTNYDSLGDILVTGKDGQVFYHRDFEWQTKPDPKTFWDAAPTKNAAEATNLRVAFYPSYDLLRWKGDFKALQGREKIQKVRVVVQNAAGKTVAQGTIAPRDFVAQGRFSLPKLASGTYTARLFLDGDAPAKTPAQSAKFVQRTDFPWLNNTIGKSEILVAPFTPIRVQNNRVETLLRSHEMGPSGFWSGVRAQNREILAAPMRLEITQNGKVQNVSARLNWQTQKPTRAVAVSRWNAGSLRGQTTSDFDYDGAMKVTLDLDSKTPVDALDLVIPLNNREMRWMHACGEGLRSNYGGAIPDGQGEVWNSSKASRDRLLGTYLPYLFVGGEERGLVFFGSNDRGWGVDPAGKIAALALERQGDTLNLRVRLIQTPHAGRRRIVFGLQATPIKPMPQNPTWRERGFQSAGSFAVGVMGMSMYWGADLYANAPRGGDWTVVRKIAEARKNANPDRPWFEKYLAANPTFRAEVGSVSNPARYNALIPYTNVRGEATNIPEWPVFKDEWQRTDFPDNDQLDGLSIDGAIIPVASRRDYLLWNYKKILENGFDGIYWDNACIFPNENPVTSDAYRRKNGALQVGTDIWELRDLVKRTATMMAEMGRRNLTMPHVTNANLLPVFGWTTVNLDWEWRYGQTDFQDRFSREYTRAVSLGRQSGNQSVILGGIQSAITPERKAWVERTRVAVTIPHELDIWQGDGIFAQVKEKLLALGYADKEAQIFNYWDENPIAKIESLDGAWLISHSSKGTALFVGDYGEGGAPRITLDFQKLGLPANFVATNFENPSERWTAQNGVLSLSRIEKHDFRLLVLTSGS